MSDWTQADWRNAKSCSQHRIIEIAVAPSMLRKLADLMEDEYKESTAGDRKKKYTIGSIEHQMNDVTEVRLHVNQTRIEEEQKDE